MKRKVFPLPAATPPPNHLRPSSFNNPATADILLRLQLDDLNSIQSLDLHLHSATLSRSRYFAAPHPTRLWPGGFNDPTTIDVLLYLQLDDLDSIQSLDLHLHSTTLSHSRYFATSSSIDGINMTSTTTKQVYGSAYYGSGFRNRCHRLCGSGSIKPLP